MKEEGLSLELPFSTSGTPTTSSNMDLLYCEINKPAIHLEHVRAF